MSLVTFEIENQVAVVKIANGKVNAISHEVIAGLNAALDAAEEAKAVVVLTGQEGMFSGGFDLTTMTKGLTEATQLVTEGSTLTRRMLAFPYPIISACSGHAIAKGAFILLCSDYRIGTAGKFKIGLNEVAIGMTMHQAGLTMATGRIPENYHTRCIVNAEIFSPEDAIAAGYLDTVVAPEQLLDTAMTVAQQMLKLDMKAHHGTKLRMRKALLERMDKAIEVDSAPLRA